MKKCPFCAEEIQDDAIVCRFCGRANPEGIRRLAERWGTLTEEERHRQWANMSPQEQAELRSTIEGMSQPPAETPGPGKEKDRKRRTSPVAWGCLVLILVGGLLVALSYVGGNASSDKEAHVSVSQVPRPPKPRPTEPPRLRDPSNLENAREVMNRARQAGLLAKIENRKVWVDPSVWNLFTYDQKLQFTYAAAVYDCQCDDADRFQIEIVNNMNGKRLAKWGLLGFKLD